MGIQRAYYVRNQIVNVFKLVLILFHNQSNALITKLIFLFVFYLNHTVGIANDHGVDA